MAKCPFLKTSMKNTKKYDGNTLVPKYIQKIIDQAIDEIIPSDASHLEVSFQNEKGYTMCTPVHLRKSERDRIALRGRLWCSISGAVFHDFPMGNPNSHTVTAIVEEEF